MNVRLIALGVLAALTALLIHPRIAHSDQTYPIVCPPNAQGSCYVVPHDAAALPGQGKLPKIFVTSVPVSVTTPCAQPSDGDAATACVISPSRVAFPSNFKTVACITDGSSSLQWGGSAAIASPTPSASPYPFTGWNLTAVNASKVPQAVPTTSPLTFTDTVIVLCYGSAP